ncbi:cystathionine beta-lyase [Oricola thermophila]|uniref:Cystathionine beta-lyase n=1 Tax=Oricola thermophila TaxID=2742145 RepID=A0A6N1VBX9_9HYPH|nr:cystathionine beta-lyase [Oricola thermophila]QKV18063.1 cystathionine beta-lyase [Oricola thermophila]
MNVPPKHNRKGINTQLAHGGYDPRSFHGFVNPPVVHASTVLFPDAQTMKTRNQKYTYGTRGTPTSDALCSAIDALEGSAGTIAVPSGLAAVTVPLLAFLSAGDHALFVDTIYNPTRRFADTMLARLGVEVEYYEPEIGAGITDLIRPNTRVIFTESPGSNTFEMQDIPAIAAVAREAGVITMLDNTWATPLFFRPLDHGVDISIHAATKYPAGHSDVLLGTVSANERCWEQLHEGFLTLGTPAGPDDVYQVFRGLRTMGVRLERHQTNALEIARWLEDQPGVKTVLHPALESHPGHAIWKRDFKGSSGIFSFVLEGGEAQAEAFLDALDIFGLGYSWGGYESLAVHVYLGDRTVSARNYGGSVIRLQIGLEDVPDLMDDIAKGLSAARQA